MQTSGVSASKRSAHALMVQANTPFLCYILHVMVLKVTDPFNMSWAVLKSPQCVFIQTFFEQVAFVAEVPLCGWTNLQLSELLEVKAALSQTWRCDCYLWFHGSEWHTMYNYCEWEVVVFIVSCGFVGKSFKQWSGSLFIQSLWVLFCFF